MPRLRYEGHLLGYRDPETGDPVHYVTTDPEGEPT